MPNSTDGCREQATFWFSLQFQNKEVKNVSIVKLMFDWITGTYDRKPTEISYS